MTLFFGNLGLVLSQYDQTNLDAKIFKKSLLNFKKDIRINVVRTFS